MPNRYVLIEHANVVLPYSCVYDGELLIEDGRIAAFGPSGTLEVPAEAVRLDARNAFLGPGLIDIHAHSCGGHSFLKDPVQAAKSALRHGITSMLPTMNYIQTTEEYLVNISRVEDAMASGECPNLRGFYMEGPFVNPKYGARAWCNPWNGGIRREDYLPILEKLGDRALVWALAPEREGIVEFMKDARKYSPRAVFSVGHSEASAEEVEALIPYGLRNATHHTNAIGCLVDHVGCHRPGVIEAVHANDCIYAELIVDSVGVHVTPYMLRLIRGKLKSRDRIILISDAGSVPQPPPPDGPQDLNFDERGGLAGSRLTLDVACRNMLRHTGCSVCDAFFYASTNPARLLGWTDRGEIAVGKVADLICVDETFGVRQVFLGGELL